EERTRVDDLRGSPMGAMSVVGVLQDDTDLMVSVMKLYRITCRYWCFRITNSRNQGSVELFLTHPELYEVVILYGVLGTGKTLLAKGVANQASATFLCVMGSELIQKWSKTCGEREIQRTMLELLNQLDGLILEEMTRLTSLSSWRQIRMTLSDDVELEEFIMSKDDLSGTDIK
ncbi:8622_t:CDS:2, partial [Cetraspora pellucida]